MGYSFLQEIAKKELEEKIINEDFWYTNLRKSKAKGIITNKGFTVLKGSIINKIPTTSFKNNFIGYIEEKKYKDIIQIWDNLNNLVDRIKENKHLIGKDINSVDEQSYELRKEKYKIKKERLKYQEEITSLKKETQIKIGKEYSNIFHQRAEGKEKILNQGLLFELINKINNFGIFFWGKKKSKIGGYQQISKNWKVLLILLILFAFVSIFLIDWAIYNSVYLAIPENIKTKDDFVKNLPLYIGSIKITFFSFLAYAIIVVNKNFSNNRHLYNVYLQKADSLEIYTAFIQTVEDKDVKNQISSQIAKTIFDPVQTGFIKESSESETNIIGKLIGNIPK